MATPIAMPRLGMTMREGRVVSWPVAVGERIDKGAPVVVIESEKTEVEVEATASGVLRHVYVPEGDTVPCGTLLGALTADGDEPFDADAFRREHDRPAPPPAAPPPAAIAPRAAPAAAGVRRAVAPAARALALQLGIDVAQVGGTGPGGRVTREDVQAWAAARERLAPASGGVRLEVLRDGRGPLVALLPGFGTDVSAFAVQARALAAAHTVLAINPRGVGASDAPALDAYDVASAADDVAALCADAAHVVGASLGAATAIELALRHPERVRSLTLITPFAVAGPRLIAVLDAWCRVAALGDAEVLARTLVPWLFGERLLADPAARERIVRGLAAGAAAVPATTLNRAATGLRRWSGSRATDLPHIGVPTLVIAAAADLLIPDGAALAARIPGARAAVVPDAGHAVTIEAGDAVTELIRAHLG
jgi:pyruvate dehydrogenase E2 component (dihydrolipoamide acetyltransferase)